MKLDKIKYEIVADLIARLDTGQGPLSLLDVGCRDTVLRRYLPAAVRYAGVDLFQNEDGTVDHVQDLMAGLPLADRSWDVVTALDVVEHVDDMKAAMDELWRVASRQLIVILPNVAYVGFRLKFLLKGHLGTDKYDMPYPGNQDRHRWLTTQQQADAFMAAFVEDKGATLEIFHTSESPRKASLARIARLFGLGPNVWAWNSLYVISRVQA